MTGRLFAVSFVLFWALPAAAQVPVPDPSLLGGEGESCRARSDCAAGLKCFEQVCTDAFKGSPCGATSECGGTYRCVGNVCVDPNTPPPPLPVPPPPPPPPPPTLQPPPPRDVSATAPSPVSPAPPLMPARPRGWMGFELGKGFHPFVGFIASPGFSIFINHNNGNLSSANPSMLFGFRGGLMFGTTELALEVSPFTYAPFLSSDVVFQANITIGDLLHVAGPVFWPLRFGAGVVAANVPGPAFETRIDLLGVAFNIGHILVDVHAPSFRAFTDFDAYSVLSFDFGLGAAYVF